MGLGCALDVTAVVYDRRSHSRIAQVTGGEPGSRYAYRRSGVDVGAASANGQRLIATGWVISNCTSTWNGKRVRIDRSRDGSHQELLMRDVAAQDRGPEEEDVSARVEGGLVTFFYQGAIGDTVMLSGPSILRYRISKSGVIRATPIALTRAGFIHEWLTLDDSNAGRWSEPPANGTAKSCGRNTH